MKLGAIVRDRDRDGDRVAVSDAAAHARNVREKQQARDGLGSLGAYLGDEQQVREEVGLAHFGARREGAGAFTHLALAYEPSIGLDEIQLPLGGVARAKSRLNAHQGLPVARHALRDLEHLGHLLELALGLLQRHDVGMLGRRGLQQGLQQEDVARYALHRHDEVVLERELARLRLLVELAQQLATAGREIHALQDLLRSWIVVDVVGVQPQELRNLEEHAAERRGFAPLALALEQLLE